MSQRSLFAAVVVVFSVLGIGVCCYGIDTRDIEAVRSKGVLDSSDLQIIDRFVAESLAELTHTKDFSSIANARSIILACCSSKESGQQQYSQQFGESAKRHIASAIAEVEGLSDQDRKAKVLTNLLILVDGLGDVRLVELALPYLKSDNKAIRYWAAHSVTNDTIYKQLDSEGLEGEKTAGRIADELGRAANDSGAETLALMVDFASKLKIHQGEELLLKIADVRISRYEDWKVRYELLDADVLRALAAKMKSSDAGASEAGRRFGQLLSFVFQRYVKGRDNLSEVQKQRLLTVLIETEKNCISELLKPQTAVKRAITADDSDALMAEHDRLLGNGTKAGDLGIRYGDSSGGASESSPRVLANPPVRSAQQ